MVFPSPANSTTTFSPLNSLYMFLSFLPFRAVDAGVPLEFLPQQVDCCHQRLRLGVPPSLGHCVQPPPGFVRQAGVDLASHGGLLSGAPSGRGDGLMCIFPILVQERMPTGAGVHSQAKRFSVNGRVTMADGAV